MMSGDGDPYSEAAFRAFGFDGQSELELGAIGVAGQFPVLICGDFAVVAEAGAEVGRQLGEDGI